MERVLASVRNAFASFWLLPSLIAVGFALAAAVLLSLDHRETAGVGFSGGAAAARSVLTVVAGSLITVTGLTFSLTIVTMQLVSGQFTPRALHGLLSDRVTQVLAGTFVGIVAYSLLVLRSVRDGSAKDPDGFVPALSTLVAIVFALAALVLLLYFIHHTGTRIQVSTILARLHEQTLTSVERTYPEEYSGGNRDEAALMLARWRETDPATVVRPQHAGYLREIALGDLVAALEQSDARVYVSGRTGDLVTERTAAIEIWNAPDNGRVESGAASALLVGTERDLRQDVDFGLQQLSDIALRALSPGVNDPTTAESAIGYIGSVLEHLVARELPDAVRRHESATVIVEQRDFDEIVALHTSQLGRFATADARIGQALLEMLGRVAAAAHRAGADDRRRATVAVARRIAAPMLEGARTTDDREALDRSLAHVTSIR